MSEILAMGPVTWQRVASAVFFGVLLGAGFCGFGLLALGYVRLIFAREVWWKALLKLVLLAPFGPGAILALPLLCLWGAWTLAEQQPVLSDWVFTGFWVWPVMAVAMWLWGNRRRCAEVVDRAVEGVARKVEKGLRSGVGCLAACLMWTWLSGWTAAVLYAALCGYGWMLAMCLTVATGSWCMFAWWCWYMRGGGRE